MTGTMANTYNRVIFLAVINLIATNFGCNAAGDTNYVRIMQFQCVRFTVDSESDLNRTKPITWSNPMKLTKLSELCAQFKLTLTGFPSEEVITDQVTTTASKYDQQNQINSVGSEEFNLNNYEVKISLNLRRSGNFEFQSVAILKLSENSNISEAGELDLSPQLPDLVLNPVEFCGNGFVVASLRLVTSLSVNTVGFVANAVRIVCVNEETIDLAIRAQFADGAELDSSQLVAINSDQELSDVIKVFVINNGNSVLKSRCGLEQLKVAAELEDDQDSQAKSVLSKLLLNCVHLAPKTKSSDCSLQLDAKQQLELDLRGLIEPHLKLQLKGAFSLVLELDPLNEINETVKENNRVSIRVQFDSNSTRPENATGAGCHLVAAPITNFAFIAHYSLHQANVDYYYYDAAQAAIYTINGEDGAKLSRLATLREQIRNLAILTQITKSLLRTRHECIDSNQNPIATNLIQFLTDLKYVIATKLTLTTKWQLSQQLNLVRFIRTLKNLIVFIVDGPLDMYFAQTIKLVKNWINFNPDAKEIAFVDYVVDSLISEKSVYKEFDLIPYRIKLFLRRTVQSTDAGKSAIPQLNHEQFEPFLVEMRHVLLDLAGDQLFTFEFSEQVNHKLTELAACQLEKFAECVAAFKAIVTNEAGSDKRQSESRELMIQLIDAIEDFNLVKQWMELAMQLVKVSNVIWKKWFVLCTLQLQEVDGPLLDGLPGEEQDNELTTCLENTITEINLWSSSAVDAKNFVQFKLDYLKHFVMRGDREPLTGKVFWTPVFDCTGSGRELDPSSNCIANMSRDDQ